MVEPVVTDEMRAKIDAMRKQARSKNMIAELKVNVTAFMEGTIENWPNNIQDKVYEALEVRSKQSGIKYTIQMSYCDVDVDTGPYIHVVATGIASLQ